MKKKKLWTLGVMLLLILSTILAACGGSDTKDTGSKDTSTGGDTASSGDPKILVYGRGGDSVALDPAVVTDGESFTVTANIYETLVNFGEQDVTIQPGLAKSWEATEDGLTYTFQLQEDVKFHDGTDFNAEAVVKNIERWKSSNDKYPYFKTQFVVGDKQIIDSATAEGDYTLVLKLSQPQAPFLKNLAMSPFAIASPTAFEEDEEGLSANPVGTGPFKFVSWVRNDSITIEKTLITILMAILNWIK